MNQQNLPTLAPGLLPGVKPNDLKKITCKNCGETLGTKFIAINELRHASPLQTLAGQPMVINFPIGFACAKCGKVNKFTVEGVEDKSEDKSKLN